MLPSQVLFDYLRRITEGRIMTKSKEKPLDAPPDETPPNPPPGKPGPMPTGIVDAPGRQDPPPPPPDPPEGED